MKKQFVFIASILFLVTVFSSCFHDHDISISVNDDDDVYRMRASFDEDQTRDVQRIINAHLHNSVSFNSEFVETNVRLDDGTSFYIKTRPGRVKIKFDRSENSEESCERLREMCDEIKDVLERGDHDEYH